MLCLYQASFLRKHCIACLFSLSLALVLFLLVLATDLRLTGTLTELDVLVYGTGHMIENIPCLFGSSSTCL